MQLVCLTLGSLITQDTYKIGAINCHTYHRVDRVRKKNLEISSWHKVDFDLWS